MQRLLGRWCAALVVLGLPLSAVWASFPQCVPADLGASSRTEVPRGRDGSVLGSWSWGRIDYRVDVDASVVEASTLERGPLSRAVRSLVRRHRLSHLPVRLGPDAGSLVIDRDVLVEGTLVEQLRALAVRASPHARVALHRDTVEILARPWVSVLTAAPDARALLSGVLAGAGARALHVRRDGVLRAYLDDESFATVSARFEALSDASMHVLDTWFFPADTVQSESTYAWEELAESADAAHYGSGGLQVLSWAPGDDERDARLGAVLASHLGQPVGRRVPVVRGHATRVPLGVRACTSVRWGGMERRVGVEDESLLWVTVDDAGDLVFSTRELVRDGQLQGLQIDGAPGTVWALRPAQGAVWAWGRVRHVEAVGEVSGQ